VISLGSIAVILALVAINGVFVAAEFAIIGAPRIAIAQLAAKGHRVAMIVRDILQDPVEQDRYIATAQLGITTASLGLGMYGEHEIAKWIAGGLDRVGLPEWIAIHAISGVIAVILLTYVHVVLGEIVPKSLALQHADRAALWIARPMLWVKTAFYPVVAGLNHLGNAILVVLRIPPARTMRSHTLEEIHYIVEESRQEGLLRREAGAVLQELLEFSELSAGEVMVPRVRTIGIPVGAAPPEIGAVLSRSPHTRYPVFEGDLDHIVGAIHIKELLRCLMRGEPLRKTRIHTPPFIPETSPLDEVLEAMIAARTQMVVVMDEHGGTAGLITVEDLFEEVIGEIDESASSRPPVYADGSGRVHAAGTARLEELGEALGMELEHEDVDTVSGIVLDELGRPPKVHDAVEYAGLRLTVTRVEGRGVAECLVTAADPALRPLRIVQR